MQDYSTILKEIKWNTDGLVAVIAQDITTREVLMLAWMNEEALLETIETQHMCYFSRSRNKLWRKGETSGQIQNLKELIIDCDGDTLLAIVEQQGVACHTGRKNCFYKTINGNQIKINQDVLKNPDKLYKK